MPSITTIATSPIAGRGLNRGPRTNVPSAPSAPQLFFKNSWVAAGKPDDTEGFDTDYTWNRFQNWWMDAACTVPSEDLPTPYTHITLITDAAVIFFQNTSYPIPFFDSTGVFEFATLNLNNNALDLVAHDVEIDAAWMSASQEDRDSGAVNHYSCAPAVGISVMGIHNNGAIPSPNQVRLFGHIELVY